MKTYHNAPHIDEAGRILLAIRVLALILTVSCREEAYGCRPEGGAGGDKLGRRISEISSSRRSSRRTHGKEQGCDIELAAHICGEGAQVALTGKGS